MAAIGATFRRLGLAKTCDTRPTGHLSCCALTQRDTNTKPSDIYRRQVVLRDEEAPQIPKHTAITSRQSTVLPT